MTPAERNRRDYPDLAKMMDEVREFFPQAKLRWGKQSDGKEVGQRTLKEKQ